jgi:hypothetical protein
VNNKDIYHKIYDENGNLDSMIHYAYGIKATRYLYIHPYGFVGIEKRSDKINDLKELPQREPKQQYLWKNLPMPEPQPTEVIEFGSWDALKLLYYLGVIIAVGRALVERIF